MIDVLIEASGIYSVPPVVLALIELSEGVKPSGRQDHQTPGDQWAFLFLFLLTFSSSSE